MKYEEYHISFKKWGNPTFMPDTDKCVLCANIYIYIAREREEFLITSSEKKMHNISISLPLDK